MIMSRLQQISKMFGGNSIFENLSLEIHDGERVGLVGHNGGGKTTIMKIIAGTETVDSGIVTWKKGIKIGYLSQIPVFSDQTLSKDVLMSAFSEVLAISKKMMLLEASMADEKGEKDLNHLLEEYGSLQESFVMLDGYEIDAKVSKVANGLGVTKLLDTPFSSLSGGEKTKICLGMILLENPDLLLLDEPTNHLDISAVEWLEQFLKDYKGSVVIVSHDRYFLDEVVTKIINLENGEVNVYHQNYSGFVIEKEKLLMEEFQAYKEQQKKIKKMKEAIKRLREWANQSYPPSEALFKRAKNMERALERIEKLKRPVLERKKMGLQFDSADRSGKDVIIIKNASKSFGGNTLFQNANVHIQYKERIAIVGNNGTGKSTLLKMIQGEVKGDEGEIRVGSNVKIGYLSQQLYMNNLNESVIEAFRAEVKVTEGEARNILAGFLFYGPSVFHKVGQLSGGERMRLRLAQLMHQDINLLILDEPTNHLDIDSREVLEEAIKDFQGTILVVSHDRYLLNKLFEKTYWIENGAIYHFAGNYSWARKKLQELSSKKEETEKAKKTVEKTKIQINKEGEKLEQFEVELEEVENSLQENNQRMEIETDLLKLQTLFEQKLILEQQRNDLYRDLEEFIG
ncbi:ABC-F type ribosomal protection protein [Bacillus cereus]|uniref:ribosomal protection-like ABC-F family protein n=1 Tax=Bacillus cereus TaxID=1396 RepID=UPI000BEB82BD|nr:ABC-F type ribosomal protection protein [Bacillus cereus]MDA2236493.1 ABC-F type ribosomal protection protein [Bacillus cereus]MEB9440214.1 ABC-F type ribosomal protection protein [Bacillus cereus]PEF89791.1 ABC transporter ATP-binding protein [Bacillus cereus]